MRKLTRPQRHLRVLKRHVDRLIYDSERQYLSWLQANYPEEMELKRRALADHDAGRAALSQEGENGK